MIDAYQNTQHILQQLNRTGVNDLKIQNNPIKDFQFIKSIFELKKLNALLNTPIVEIVHGDANGLLEFMKRHPQTDDEGRLRYLLTSGVAIELITGFERKHHDLDIGHWSARNGFSTQNLS